MADLLKNPIFKDETKAREWLEARVWPEGPTCPHCGNADKAKIKELEGKAHRAGLYQCAECREQYRAPGRSAACESRVQPSWQRAAASPSLNCRRNSNGLL
jgi:transposase-like protein